MTVPTELLHGEPIAAEIRSEVDSRVTELSDCGLVPTLGTVLMSEDPADERFVALKHAACDDVRINSRDVRIDPSEPAIHLYDTVEHLCADPDVHGVFVQAPLPEHVSAGAVRRRIDPAKDVDCFHPVNVGRLVAGSPRFVPATPAAVRHLLDRTGHSVEGKHVVIVGRSAIIGIPLANLLLRDEQTGNATVTVCHRRTEPLDEKTRRADVLVTACGVPELIDGSMLSPDVVVVDVSVNSPTGEGSDRTAGVVGDVEFESAREVATAITPVPGGVGPITLAMLLQNVVCAAERSFLSARR